MALGERYEPRLHEAYETFRRRFHALAAEADRLHIEWQEAVRRQDIDLQARPIAREHDALAELIAVITVFQEGICQRHQAG